MNKQIRNFALDCATQYGEYNATTEQYTVGASDLPDFVRHEFASLIMAIDESYAAEATSSDNRNWDAKMLPALTKYLANSTDQDEAIEFNNVWRDCVTDHFTNKMNQLLDEAVSY